MGTRGQMFWLKPDLPGSLAPGKRPRTTLSPSFALRDGRPWMSFGTPGGDQQDQWQTIFFLRMVHHGMNIQEAIDAPSFHSEHFPSSFWPRIARPGKLVLEGRVRAGCCGRADPARAQGRARGRMDRGTALGGPGRGRADARRSQSSGHAGLRCRAVGPVFADGRSVEDYATGCASGRPIITGSASIAMAVVDMAGQADEGRLEPGANPVCITLRSCLRRPEIPGHRQTGLLRVCYALDPKRRRV